MTAKINPISHWLVLLVILLLAWGLRLWGLADHSIWWDEGYTTWLIRHDVGRMNQITATDTHPPLYFWGLHVWRSVVGESEFLLRFPSAALGTLAVAAVYCLTRSLGGRRSGLLAALFLAVSRFAITWSQETRMYILAALLATLALWAAIRYWQTSSRYAWLGYVLAMTAGLMTLYLYVSVLIVANLAWLVVGWQSASQRRRLAGWTAAQVAVLALFALWLAYALPRIPSWSIAEAISPAFFVRLYATLLATGVPVAIERYTLPVLSVMVVLLAGLVALWLDRRRAPRRDLATGAGAIGLILGLLLPAAIVYSIALPVRFFYTPKLAPRYLLILSCCFYALLAWGIMALARRRFWLGWFGAGVVLVVALTGLIDFYPDRIRRDDYVSLSLTLRAFVQPDDGVVLLDDTDWPIFAAHYAGDWHGVPSSRPNDPVSVEAFLTPIWDTSQGVWLVKTAYALQSDPQEQMQRWLADRSLGEISYRYADSELRFFPRTPERAATLDELAPEHTVRNPLEVEVTPGLHLIGAQVAVPTYRIGDTLHLFLYWEHEATGSSDAEGTLAPVELALVSRDEQTVKTVPIKPASDPGRRRQQIDVPLTADLSPGRYTLRLGDHEIAHFRLAATRTATRNTKVIVSHPLDRQFAASAGDVSIRLLGYDLTQKEVQRGDQIELTLYWSGTAPITNRYKVFTHLLSDRINPATGSLLWGQHDAEPDNFARPTPTWLPDEIIIDRHAIPVDSSAPPGKYRVEIGLYDGLSGTRLAVFDEDGTPLGDHVTLEEVTVP